MRAAFGVLALALSACGSNVAKGGLQVDVTYSLVSPGDACVRVSALPDTGAPATVEVPRGAMSSGTLSVAINRDPAWPVGVTLIATLHAGDCAAPAVVTRTVSARFPSGT